MSKKFTGTNLVPNPVGQSTKAQISATKYDASYSRFKAKQEKKHSDGVLKEFEYHLAHDADIIKAIAGGAYRQMDFSKLSPIQRRLLFLFIVVHASGVIGSIQTAKDSVPKRRGDIDAKDDASKSSSAKAESSDKIKNPSWLGNAGNSSIVSEAKLVPTMMEQINATANATETARVADPKFIQSVTAGLRSNYEALQNATDAGMSSNNPYYQALERNALLMANETLAGYPEGLVNRTIEGIKTGAETVNRWFKEHDPLPNFLGAGVQAAPDDPDGPTPPPPPPPSTTTKATTTTRFNPSTNTTITTTTFAPVTNTTVMPDNTTVAVTNSTITTTIAPTSISRVENTTITSTSTTPTTTTTTKTTTTITTQAPTTTTQDPTTTTYNPTTTIETTTETITTRPSTSVATTPTPTTTTTTTTTGTVTDPATNATYAVTTTNATTTGSTAAAPTNTTKIVLTSTTAPNTTITIATTSSANGTVNGTATKTTAATSTTPEKTTTKSGSSKNGDDIALIVGLAVGLGVGVPVGIVAKVACSRRNIRNRKKDRVEALEQPNAVYEEPVPIPNVDVGLYEPVTNERHYYAAVKSGNPKALNLTTDNAYDYAETVLDSSPHHKPRPQFNLVYLNGSEAAADPYYDNVKLDSNVDEDGLPLPDDHLYALATPALPPKNRTTMTQEEASGQQGAPNPTTMRRERSSPIASQSDNAPPVPPRPGKLEEAGRLSQNHAGGGRTGEK